MKLHNAFLCVGHIRELVERDVKNKLLAKCSSSELLEVFKCTSTSLLLDAVVREKYRDVMLFNNRTLTE